MNTEITDNRADTWLLYDGDCGFCARLAGRFCGTFARHGVRCAPLQEPWVAPTLHLSRGELLDEMRLLKPDGSFMSGAAAVVELSRFLWWAKPIGWIPLLPGGMRLLNCAYKWVARNRRCRSGVRERRPATNPAPLFAFCAVLLVISALHASALPRWIVMWGIAGAIWFCLKMITTIHARAMGLKLRPGRLLGYLLAWPGTDSISFFRSDDGIARPRTRDYLSGLLNVVSGAALISVAPRVGNSLLSGWLAMVGIIFVLHFGIFKLLSAIWVAKGADARPLMDFPVAARSLGEFWGRRWNTGFSIPARRHILEPLRQKTGPAVALLVVFLVSGLVHEFAISLPAEGGYGLPTLYFLFQAAAILFERSALGKRLGLRRGIRGRIFALGCAGAPAFWLFHPPFVERVILPFLHAIHSLKGALV